MSDQEYLFNRNIIESFKNKEEKEEKEDQVEMK